MSVVHLRWFVMGRRDLFTVFAANCRLLEKTLFPLPICEV